MDTGGKAQRSTSTPSVALKEQPVAMTTAMPTRRNSSKQQATPVSNSGQRSQQATRFSKSGQCSQQHTPFSNQRRIIWYNCCKVAHSVAMLGYPSPMPAKLQQCSTIAARTEGTPTPTDSPDDYMFQIWRSWKQSKCVSTQ